VNPNGDGPWLPLSPDAWTPAEPNSATEPAAPGTRRPRNRRSRNSSTPTLAAIATLAFAAAFTLNPATGTLLSLDLPWTLTAPRTDLPPAGLDEQPTPLGTPAPLTPAAQASTAYRFIETRPNGDPITFSPCRPIRWVLNPAHQPPGAEPLITAALNQASTFSGFQFRYEGTTTETPTSERTAYQPDRYGDRWAPVLIAWSPTSMSVPGDGTNEILGRAGATTMTIREPDGTTTVGSTSGQLVLSAPAISGLLEAGETALVQAVIEHEIGHLLGLDHLNDPTQLMHPNTGNVTTYQLGDRHGLHILGSQPCIPSL
jgi:hypothetical protein